MNAKGPIADAKELERIADASSTFESFLRTVEKRGYDVATDKEEIDFQRDDEFLKDFYRFCARKPRPTESVAG